MNFNKGTLEELECKGNAISSKNAVVGFDGFVDKIMTVVDKRLGPGDNFTAINRICELGTRISGAAGKSTNIEVYPKTEKIGGNGPIMANALLTTGMHVKYLGALGKPSIHPVFKEFAKRTDAVSVSEPGVTLALEFSDGKIMINDTSGIENITYFNILDNAGEGAFYDALSRANLISLLNWTMIPNMTAIFVALLENVLPNLPPHNGRLFFFDLSDPQKRPDGDLKVVLSTITRFRSHGNVCLGLNYKEAQQVFKVLGHKTLKSDAMGLKKMATLIRQDLEIQYVVIHPLESAACATKDDSWWIQGTYTNEPKITTGAGDHFNAGFTIGLILGLSPPACLTLAVAFSSYYVSTAKSPSLFDIDNFIRNWN